MATNYYNVEMGVVDASGNLNVIYPVTTANNVAVGTNETLASRLNTINSNLNTLQNKGFYVASMNTSCNLNSSASNYGKKAINNISLSGNILIFANFFIEFRRDSYTEAGTFGVSIGGSEMKCDNGGIEGASILVYTSGGPRYRGIVTSYVDFKANKTDHVSMMYQGNFNGILYLGSFKGAATSLFNRVDIVVFRC